MIIDEERYFGIVMWCDDDIVQVLEDMGVEPTPEHIAAVRDNCQGSHFTDRMIEAGWDSIRIAAEYVIEDNDRKEAV